MVHRSFLLPALLSFGTACGQSLYFPPTFGSAWETQDPAALNWCTDQVPPLLDFLESTNTKAFLVLKDGRIVIEHYFGTFTADSLWYWASAGKSLTAFLVGKAQEEGFLDIDDPSSAYLGVGWTSCTPEQEAAITIRNQLTMTSGLDDSGDLDCTAPACLQFLAEPGTRWSYHNAPYTLLDGVIEDATGQSLNSYLFSKLTVTTGLQGAFVQIGSNNVFLSKARAMARFGLLALAQGQWNGEPIMTDSDYFQAMVTPSQALNPAYGYLWWLNGQSTYMLPGIQLSLPGMLCPAAPSDMYSAMGKNGQICNVSPAEGLVVVRLGDLPTQGVFVPNAYNDQIWQYLNAVMCSTTSIQENTTPRMELFPNPSRDRVEVRVGQGSGEITVRDGSGRIVLSQKTSSERIGLDVSGLASGCYTVAFRGESGAATVRFVKE